MRAKTKTKNALPNENILKIKKHWRLLALFALPLIWYLIFCYVPMYGIQIGFKDFIPNKGFAGSPWVGLKHFERFFSSYYAWDTIWNTVSISLYSIIVGFPIPIFLAIIINELRSKVYKKTLQNMTYIPYFLSIVVVCGMLDLFLSPVNGVVNQALGAFGVDPIPFLESDVWYKTVYVLSGVWQTSGWSAIIYIAALMSIDSSLYEAATIDGASKIQKILKISIPGITPTIATLFIMRMGQIMNVGFEKALLLQNPLNIGSSEIISTLTYTNGILQGDYSYSTAVGVMNSVVNLILIICANIFSKKAFETSLW